MISGDPLRPLDQLVAAYDSHFIEIGNLRETDAFYQWVLEKLAPQPGRRLLDVACGEGHLLRWARRIGLDVHGVDFSGAALQRATHALPPHTLSRADGHRLPFATASFDYVTNIGSLEHFADPDLGLAEMVRVVKPEGQVAIFLPNSYFLLDILWHVWRTGYPVSHRQIIERFATAGQWRDLLERNGLVVDQTFKYNLAYPRSREDWQWYRRSPLKLAYLVANPFTPLNLSYSFLFICHPIQ